MPQRRTFLLLKPENYLSAENSQWLGRCVTLPEDPNLFYTPDDPGAILGPGYTSALSAIGSEIMNDDSNDSFSLSIKPVLKTVLADNKNYDLTVTNSVFTVRDVKNYYKSFEKIVNSGSVRDDLLQQIQNGNKIYMITAVKSVVVGEHGSVSITQRDDQQKDVSIKIPVSDAAKLMGYPIPSSVDPEIVIQLRKQYGIGTVGTLVGEQIFAVEYYNIVNRNGNLQLAQNETTWLTFKRLISNLFHCIFRKRPKPTQPLQPSQPPQLATSSIDPSSVVPVTASVSSATEPEAETSHGRKKPRQNVDQLVSRLTSAGWTTLTVQGANEQYVLKA